MQIIKSQYLDFCSGVRHAVDTAMDLASKGAYCIGEIIHNRYVTSRLAAMGLQTVNNAEAVPNGATVLIRSHGASPEVFRLLSEKGCQIVDCTCPFVKHIHDIVRTHSLQGEKIIILGEPTHPEVIGINGYCNDSAVIISSEEQSFTAEQGKKYCLVVQTTFDADNFTKISLFIKNNLKTLEIYNTICYTTQRRQAEAKEISRKSDVVLVIGDVTSSNCAKLTAVCKGSCSAVHLISTKEDVQPYMHKNKIGIIAAASTPKELIEEVINFMSETQDNTTPETEVTAESTVETEIAAAPAEEAVAAPTAEVAVQKEVIEDTDDEMTRLLKESEKAPKIVEGRKMRCKIVSADAKGIIVGIGSKKDGFIDAEDACLDGEEYRPEDFVRDEYIEAKVISNKAEGLISLSRKQVLVTLVEEAKLSAPEFKMKPTEAVKGGLIGKVGEYEVFVPASQIRMGFVKEEELQKYVGKELRLRVIDSVKKDEEQRSRKRKKVVASQRVILEEERKATEDAMWATIEKGAVVNGKVSHFSPFGAFINVNGLDCLCHISELSWARVNKPEEVLTKGESYDFVIKEADREKNRVSLTRKPLIARPIDVARESFPVGTIVRGVVERVFPFGAFVRIAPGVDGLVHVSQINDEFVKDATTAIFPGDEVVSVITAFEKDRITLSIKEYLRSQNAAKETEATEGEEGEDKKAKRFAAKPDKGAKRGFKDKKPKEEDQDYIEGSSQSKSNAFGILSGFTVASEEAPADTDDDKE